MSAPLPAVESATAVLRRRRHVTGLTQRELAERSGIPQPNIAAYETGRRIPSATTLARLDRVLDTPTMQVLRSARVRILAAARRRHIDDVRVFGSVARGEADDTSDVDLLVHPLADASLFDLAGFMAEVEDILGRRVDVVADDSTGPVMPHILDEAVPL